MSYDNDDDYFFEGKATDLGKFFFHGDDILYLAPGCFDAARGQSAVQLLIGHDESKAYCDTSNHLEIHYGPDAVVFRVRMPASFKSELDGVAGSFEDYNPVSIGFKKIRVEKKEIDGAIVQIIHEAQLSEVSILQSAPALKSTYARVVHASSCGTLRDDYESGRFALASQFISLHRKVAAMDNDDGKVDYVHRTTDYERKAKAFERALVRLG